MTIPIAYSPCPNDTFIFDAMVHGRIDTEGLSFEPYLADVEALNSAAFAKTYPVTKVSYAAMAQLQQEYRLLDAGSALGEGIGPLLITRGERELEEIADHPVAIPGEYTTAAFLLRLAYPELRVLRPMLFSDIEAAIAEGGVTAGVIIHETRFTYADRGFRLVRDLGAYWEETTGLPIPLGGIAVRRDIPLDVQATLARVLWRSVSFALAAPSASEAYVAEHAQEMSAEIQKRHIDTYVNGYSVRLGERGTAAVRQLFALAHERGIAPAPAEDLLVEASG